MDLDAPPRWFFAAVVTAALSAACGALLTAWWIEPQCLVAEPALHRRVGHLEAMLRAGALDATARDRLVDRIERSCDDRSAEPPPLLCSTVDEVVRRLGRPVAGHRPAADSLVLEFEVGPPGRAAASIRARFEGGFLVGWE